MDLRERLMLKNMNFLFYIDGIVTVSYSALSQMDEIINFLTQNLHF